MTVGVDNTPNLGLEVSLTPEIYYMLSDQDRSELGDPQTRQIFMNRLKSEAIFEHDDLLLHLELFLAREDRKQQNQEQELKSSNSLICTEKQAAMERFLESRTSQEEEEDERIRQREIEVAIKVGSHNEYEIQERAGRFLFRVAVLSILERQLQEEISGRLGTNDVESRSRVEEVDSADEGDNSNPEEASIYGRSSARAWSTLLGRGRTNRQYEDDDAPDAIHSQPGTARNKRISTKGSNQSTENDGDGCLDGFWKCIASCISCCV